VNAGWGKKKGEYFPWATSSKRRETQGEERPHMNLSDEILHKEEKAEKNRGARLCQKGERSAAPPNKNSIIGGRGNRRKGLNRDKSTKKEEKSRYQNSRCEVTENRAASKDLVTCPVANQGGNARPVCKGRRGQLKRSLHREWRNAPYLHEPPQQVKLL